MIEFDYTLTVPEYPEEMFEYHTTYSQVKETLEKMPLLMIDNNPLYQFSDPSTTLDEN